MKTLADLIRILKENRTELESRFHVKRIGIFGSYARSEETDSSDVDILVELSQPIGLNLVDLIYFLEEKIGERVDLVTVKSLRSEFEEAILKEVVYT